MPFLAMSHLPVAERLPMAPLRRRLGRIELYSQIIYNSSGPWIARARTAQDVLFKETPRLVSFPRRPAANAAAKCAPGGSGPSTGSRLDDDFAFHVRVDQAQVVVFARGCKSERELVVLDERL